MTDQIDYGNLMHDAMRGLIRKVLTQVSKDGLPGQHHFFINFDTSADGVSLADWMFDRFPEDMTIVLQHWFEDLSVDEDGFGVTLNFGDTPETLYIPYDAINTFVDPSVEFGLRFEVQDDGDEEISSQLHLAGEGNAEPVEEDAAVSDPEHDDAAPQGDAEVVSLDRFRKEHS